VSNPKAPERQKIIDAATSRTLDELLDQFEAKSASEVQVKLFLGVSVGATFKVTREQAAEHARLHPRYIIVHGPLEGICSQAERDLLVSAGATDLDRK
jgi:hypothetical protein